EPSPHVFERLWRNAQLNQLTDLRLNQVALADSDGTGSLFIPGVDGDTNASLVPGFNAAGDCISVPLMRFDSYFDAHTIQRVDLVKIDVEGAELNVLHGMGSFLETCQPDIIVEVLEPFDGALDQFFRNSPYRKFLITNHGLREMDRIHADSIYR